MEIKMKIVILTSNSLRHKFLANTLSQHCEDTLIISECKPQTSFFGDSETTEIEKHFLLRDETEKSFFPNDHYFIPKTIPILYKEANSPYVYEIIKNFKPNILIVFGSSIIKEPLISLLPKGQIIGLSKIPRIVDAFSRRLQVQERLTNQIAHCLDKILKLIKIFYFFLWNECSK